MTNSAVAVQQTEYQLISPVDQKKTKIVATIGPATESEQKIGELISAGMNVARFNTKHNQPSWHREVVQRVRKVAAQMQVPIGILIDLQGPEIRITLKKDQLEVKKGETATFSAEGSSTQESDILVPLNVVDSLNVGNHVLMDDGMCHFVIVSKTDHHFTAECLHDCIVKTRKTLNTPNVVIDMPALIPEDEIYLEELREEQIDFIALSFVRSAQDISHLRNVLAQKKLTSDVIAKIENRKAVDNLESIIEASDGIMVARGDLAIEVDFEELIYWQKKIIASSLVHAKPVITATQMLASMTQKPIPTRAEISDVANAVYDGTDAEMLSEETTTGQYPIKTVEVQAKIVQFYEQHTSESLPNTENQLGHSPLITATLEIFKNTHQGLEKIIVVSDRLDFVRELSSFHLRVPIWVIAPTLQIAQKLTLSFGVRPLHIPNFDLSTASMDALFDILKKNQKLSLGERVLFVYNLDKSNQSNSNAPLVREVT